ncbi:Stk1 family PASTA domain-containing Ser/Thr kinase [Arthrobacter halodurans]|uniref:non-specific serine/threonine protein kinase n=1 Tax=Arthrobacter halodurans TaxID=516699 RepID=A0ABV4UIX2_9MICC
MTKPRILNGRYHVGELIGRGGMADVHHGRDLRLGREVAIKLLRSDLARDPMFQARFRREAQAVAGLNHPSIVAVYDTGEEEVEGAADHDVRAPFIVMEYVEGRTLRDLLRAGEITVESAGRYTLGVLKALEYSHRKGIVHRDIKPANVMVTGEDAVKVMDFGIARAMADSGATMTQTQAVVGTAQYLSPEQARGETVDARSDLYSAGCLLYELLAGRPPFIGDSPVSVAYQHVGEDAAPPSDFNPDVGPALDRVIATALRKDREDRYQDAAAFGRALAAGLAGAEIPGDLGDATAALAVSAPDTRAMGAVAVTDAPADALTGPATDAGHTTRRFGAAALAAGAAASETPNDAGPEPPRGSLPLGLASLEERDDERAQLEAFRHDERRRKGAWMTVFAIVAVVVLATGAWFLWTWTQQERARTATVAVPSVANLTLTEAQNALLSANLIPITEEVFHDSIGSGLAVGTDPAATEAARVQSEVTLLISKGPEQMTLPSELAGQTEASVRSELEQLGLVVGDVGTANSSTVPGDRLIDTNPRLGEQVKSGSTVDLVLSTGNVTVPNLIDDDLTVEQAREVLGDEAVQLRLDVREVVNTVLEPGTITRQEPEAGTDLPQGGVVTVTVAKAPPAAPSEDADSESPAPPSSDEPTPSETAPSEPAASEPAAGEPDADEPGSGDSAASEPASKDAGESRDRSNRSGSSADSAGKAGAAPGRNRP